MYDATLAETVAIRGDGGDEIEAYLARPMSPGPLGGVVVIHHMPGYDAPTKEIARRFAAEGYNALMPNLYYRDAPGASGQAPRAPGARATRSRAGAARARGLDVLAPLVDGRHEGEHENDGGKGDAHGRVAPRQPGQIPAHHGFHLGAVEAWRRRARGRRHRPASGAPSATTRPAPDTPDTPDTPNLVLTAPSP